MLVKVAELYLESVYNEIFRLRKINFKSGKRKKVISVLKVQFIILPLMLRVMRY